MYPGLSIPVKSLERRRKGTGVLGLRKGKSQCPGVLLHLPWLIPLRTWGGWGGCWPVSSGAEPRCLMDYWGLQPEKPYLLSSGVGICSSHPWLLTSDVQKDSLRDALDKELARLLWGRALQFTHDVGHCPQKKSPAIRARPPPACAAPGPSLCLVSGLTPWAISPPWSLQHCISTCLTEGAAIHSRALARALHQPPTPPPATASLVQPPSHSSPASSSRAPDSRFSFGSLSSPPPEH